MRRIVVTQNITADGRIEMIDPWFEPSPQTPQADLVEEVERQSAESDSVLLGRATFEAFRSYWPQHTDEVAGASLQRQHKYVVSNTMTDPEWDRSTILTGDAVESVRALKKTDGGDVVLTGSIQLCHAVLGAGLAEEIRLFVFPYVQGRGACLVDERATQRPLRLLESRAFANGVTLQRYAVERSDDAG